MTNAQVNCRAGSRRGSSRQGRAARVTSCRNPGSRLQPIAASAAPIEAALPLRHDAFEAESRTPWRTPPRPSAASASLNRIPLTPMTRLTAPIGVTGDPSEPRHMPGRASMSAATRDLPDRAPAFGRSVGGGTIINYYRKARHELSVARKVRAKSEDDEATPKEEIFRYASVPDDGRVRGAALKPQGARSFRVQGGPRLADTSERLNPALRRALGFTRVFCPSSPAFGQRKPEIFVIPDRRWLKGKFRKSGLTSLS